MFSLLQNIGNVILFLGMFANSAFKEGYASETLLKCIGCL